MAARFTPETFPQGWRDDVTAWVEHLQRAGNSESTIAGYALHVGWLARDLHDSAPTPWDVTSKGLADWLAPREWSLVTRRKVIGSIRSLYVWGISNDLAGRSPLAGVPMLPARPRGPGTLPIPPRWDPAVQEWTNWMKSAACSAGTIRLRRSWVRQLAETYGDPWAVTAEDLALFLSRDDWKPETKRSALSSLRAFYRWAVRAGHLDASPAAALDPVKAPRGVPRPATDEAVVEAIARADDRTRLALLLGLLAGLRRGEISRLHTKDIGVGQVAGVEAATLHIIGKGSNERLVPLHPVLADALRQELRRRERGDSGSGWRADMPARGWLFPSLDPDRPLTPGHIGKLIERVLPEGFTPHTLRHRFATQAYASERDLLAVQQLLGHASLNTTRRYTAAPATALVDAVASIKIPAR